MAVSWLFCKRRFLRLEMLKVGREENMLPLAVMVTRLVRLLTWLGRVALG